MEFKDLALSIQPVYDCDFPIVQYYIQRFQELPSSVTDAFYSIAPLRKYIEQKGATLLAEYIKNDALLSAHYLHGTTIISVHVGRIYSARKKNNCEITVYNRDFNTVKETIKELASFKEDKLTNKGFYMLVQTNMGTELQDFAIDPIEVDVDVNYGSDFREIHDSIVYKLKNKSSGLYMMHGETGSGKTSYIKYLGQIIGKKMIFVPANLTHYLDKPDFTALLLDFPDSILVIEDAEKSLQSR